MVSQTMLLAFAAQCALVAHTFAARAPLYGISEGEPSYLVKINYATGNSTKIGPPLSNELAAQGLAAIDSKKQVYYVLDFNDTSAKPNLLGFSLKDGRVVVDITIDLSETAFVGVGQSIGVDPLTGVVIINGHDSTVQGHHFISVNPWGPNPSKAKSIVKIPAPNVYLLGGSSTVDWDNGVMYVKLVMPPNNASVDATTSSWSQPFTNTSSLYKVKYAVSGKHTHVGTGSDQAPPPPAPPFSVDLVAVDYKHNTFETVIAGNALGTLAYDETKKEVLGFGETVQPDGTYAKVILALSTSKHAVRTVGVVKSFTGEMGPITTVDSKARVHYSLLQPPGTPFLPSDKCASSGFPCKNSTCCAQAPGGPSCFAVTTCSELDGPPSPDTPFQLAQLSMDTAASVSKAPPICSITGGDCPWSLEAAEEQTVEDSGAVVTDI